MEYLNRFVNLIDSIHRHIQFNDPIEAELRLELYILSIALSLPILDQERTIKFYT